MIKWNKKFEYPKTIREAIEGQRHYVINDEKLPSVTTILSATQSEEKKASLERWKQNVGEQTAENIKNTAANRGSIMHHIIESYLLEQRHADLSDLGRQAGVMAQTIYNEGLEGCMDEIWGSEVALYYPELYAGATDLVGVYEGKEAIVDFKQSNKPKRREYVDDYFTQLVAYAMAHNAVYGTKINKGVVLMCTKDNYFQRFVLEGQEFNRYVWQWLRRVDEYYGNKVSK
jgi:ATP-dependent exoDNAse (exonuclease V) beta subunit